MGKILENFMYNSLEERRKKHNFRSLAQKTGLIDFTSNDYLGLARNRDLQLQIHEKALLFDANGATGSRLLTGNSLLFNDVEEKIARYHKAPAALIYNSGYVANLGFIDAMINEGDCVLYDLHVHASIRDGLRMNKSISFPFRHNDPIHLEKRLKAASTFTKVFVLIESVYSLDGSIAPAKEICALCEKYNAYLVVDEAHAIGILGLGGRGLICELNLENQVFARVSTYGKAFGVHGAAVLGSTLLKDFLINFSRPFCYTTAMSTHSLLAIDCAYDFIESANPERAHLCQLIEKLQTAAIEFSLPLYKSCTPIQAVQVQGNERAREFSKQLAESGFDLRPILSPTVRQGEELLRLCLHSFNTHKELDELIELLKRFFQ